MSTRAIRLSALLEGAGVRPRAACDVDPEIRGASLDSRTVEPGHLFFALRGRVSDGATFVPEAIRRGARAVVADSARPSWVAADVAWVTVDRPRQAAGLLSRQVYRRPDESLTLVGITGTNGKTTVAHMVESIAAAAGKRAGRIGTLGYAFDGNAVPLPRTTPEAPEFYRLLAEMRDRSVEVVAVEVSSHALALSRVEGARFSIGAFLNLGRDHLDFHMDASAYFDAKARLFEELREEQCAVLPADSPHGSELARRTRARVLTFGRSESAMVRLLDERGDVTGSSARLATAESTIEVRTALPGRFNLDNAAAAAACALALRLPEEAIAAGLRELRCVPGRTERVDRGQPFAVLVDYAHTEEALDGLLTWVREITGGDLHVVFGCGGDRDRGKRAGMGRAAALLADRIYLTSDNPRSEDPERILDEVAEGVAEVEGAPQRCERQVDRAEAIRAAIGAAAADDVVVIAGKGHESTQTIGDRVLPFDDRLVAGAALEALGFRGAEHADA